MKKAPELRGEVFTQNWQFVVNMMIFITGLAIAFNHGFMSFDEMRLSDHLLLLWGFALIVGVLGPMINFHLVANLLRRFNKLINPQ